MIKVQIELDEYEVKPRPDSIYLSPLPSQKKILDSIVEISNRPEYSHMKVYAHDVEEKRETIRECKYFLTDSAHWREIKEDFNTEEDDYVVLFSHFKVKRFLNIYFQ